MPPAMAPIWPMVQKRKGSASISRARGTPNMAAMPKPGMVPGPRADTRAPSRYMKMGMAQPFPPARATIFLASRSMVPLSWAMPKRNMEPSRITKRGVLKPATICFWVMPAAMPTSMATPKERMPTFHFLRKPRAITPIRAAREIPESRTESIAHSSLSFQFGVGMGTGRAAVRRTPPASPPGRAVLFSFSCFTGPFCRMFETPQIAAKEMPTFSPHPPVPLGRRQKKSGRDCTRRLSRRRMFQIVSI